MQKVLLCDLVDYVHSHENLIVWRGFEYHDRPPSRNDSELSEEMCSLIASSSPASQPASPPASPRDEAKEIYNDAMTETHSVAASSPRSIDKYSAQGVAVCIDDFWWILMLRLYLSEQGLKTALLLQSSFFSDRLPEDTFLQQKTFGKALATLLSTNLPQRLELYNRLDYTLLLNLFALDLAHQYPRLVHSYPRPRLPSPLKGCSGWYMMENEQEITLTQSA